MKKRDFSSEERERLSGTGAAMPDGSFPIVTRVDLQNAISAFGRASDQPAVARHIARRARSLGATDLLPKEGKLADLIGKSFEKGCGGGGSGGGGGLRQGRRRKMLKFVINELSAVDKPAQEGARALLLKRREEGPGVRLLVVKNAEGELVSSVELEDTFTINIVTGSEEHGEEGIMDEATKKALKDAQDAAKAAETKATDLEAQLKRANLISELTDAQRAHFKSLDKAGQDEYLGKSADEREAVIKRAKDDDEVVFRSADGTEYHKSDDPRVVKMAKERDEDRKELAKVRGAREQDALEKRAAETLPNLPGELKTRAAVLKAIDGIEDEKLRGAAHEAIVAGDKAIKAAFDTVGTRRESESSDSEQELDKLAKARMKEKDEDYFTAYDAVAKANPELAKRAIEGN